MAKKKAAAPKKADGKKKKPARRLAGGQPQALKMTSLLDGGIWNIGNGDLVVNGFFRNLPGAPASINVILSGLDGSNPQGGPGDLLGVVTPDPNNPANWIVTFPGSAGYLNVGTQYILQAYAAQLSDTIVITVR